MITYDVTFTHFELTQDEVYGGWVETKKEDHTIPVTSHVYSEVMTGETERVIENDLTLKLYTTVDIVDEVSTGDEFDLDGVTWVVQQIDRFPAQWFNKPDWFGSTIFAVSKEKV